MKIITEETITNFRAWSGAVETQKRIINEDKENEFDQLIEECYPTGLTDTELNDLLWFEEDWIYENLGIENNENC